MDAGALSAFRNEGQAVKIPSWTPASGWSGRDANQQRWTPDTTYGSQNQGANGKIPRRTPEAPDGMRLSGTSCEGLGIA
jgi:hypothetical protein